MAKHTHAKMNSIVYNKIQCKHNSQIAPNKRCKMDMLRTKSALDWHRVWQYSDVTPDASFHIRAVVITPKT